MTSKIAIHSRARSLIVIRPALSAENDLLRQTAECAANSSSADRPDHDLTAGGPMAIVDALTAVPLEAVVGTAFSEHIPSALTAARRGVECLCSRTSSDRLRAYFAVEVIRTRRVTAAALKRHRVSNLDGRRISGRFAAKIQSARSGATADHSASAFARILSAADHLHAVRRRRRHFGPAARRRAVTKHAQIAADWAPDQRLKTRLFIADHGAVIMPRTNEVDAITRIGVDAQQSAVPALCADTGSRAAEDTLRRHFGRRSGRSQRGRRGSGR